jgi:hypothetical protein
MKKRNLQRIFAAFMATAMAVTAAGCSSKGGDSKPTDAPATTDTPATTSAPATTQAPDEGGDTTPEPTPDTKVDIPADEFYAVLNDEGIYVDQNGNKIDLGGIHVTIRDWFSNGRKEADQQNDYDRAQYAYWDEMEELYNFTFEKKTIGDWGTVPGDFVAYATAPDDGEYYAFTLRDDAAVTSAMANGLMYDLTTLHALDFTEKKFTDNMLHDAYGKNGHIYCMYAGAPEPRTGVYMNKKVLKDANIDFNEIYDLQKNDQWTWEKFEEYCAKIQRDTDADGVDDVFAICCNEGAIIATAVASNGGSLVGKDANGYFYNVEDPRTIEALNWIRNLFITYDRHPNKPEDAQWNYYQDEFKNGTVAFLLEDEYAGMGTWNYLYGVDFEYGFVMFPKGPQGKLINCWANNPVCIPTNYSKMKAGQIAFVWNLVTDPVPDWEDYNAVLVDARLNGNFDDRAKNETIPMMVSSEHGTVTYHGIIPDLDVTQLLWHINENEDLSAVIEGFRDQWKEIISKANN